MLWRNKPVQPAWPSREALTLEKCQQYATEITEHTTVSLWVIQDILQKHPHDPLAQLEGLFRVSFAANIRAMKNGRNIPEIECITEVTVSEDVRETQTFKTVGSAAIACFFTASVVGLWKLTGQLVDAEDLRAVMDGYNEFCKVVFGKN